MSEQIVLKVGPSVVRAMIDAEVRRLDAAGGTAPFGGWRNRAIITVAESLGENPYRVDRYARGVTK